MRAIEGRALQSEAMGLCLGATFELSLWSERPGKNVSAEPSTKDGIETVCLCASLLQAHPSIDAVSSFVL